jgi:hypothetical protein
VRCVLWQWRYDACYMIFIVVAGAYTYTVVLARCLALTPKENPPVG